MSVLGIGVDITLLSRFSSLLQRRSARRLATRILSLEEEAALEGIAPENVSQRVKFMAVRCARKRPHKNHIDTDNLFPRWAVKEAAYKALYPTIVPTWRELTYRSALSSSRQKPSLIFRPDDEKNIGLVGKLHVTVSHDGDYVVAQVLAERPINQDAE
jgi:holo-[acyl-carrier protein] synthase